jgi:hypothetical protein
MTWTSFVNPVPGTIGLASSYTGDYVYALTKQALYVSQNFGTKFTFKYVFPSSNAKEIIVSQSGANILILFTTMVLRSTDYGSTFKWIPHTIEFSNPSSLAGSDNLELFYFLNGGSVVMGTLDDIVTADTQPTDDDNAVVNNVYCDGAGVMLVASVFADGYTTVMISRDRTRDWENADAVSGNAFAVIPKIGDSVNFITVISPMDADGTLRVSTTTLDDTTFVLRSSADIGIASIRSFSSTYSTDRIIMILDDSSIYYFDTETQMLNKINSINNATVSTYSGDGTHLFISAGNRFFVDGAIPNNDFTWWVILLIILGILIFILIICIIVYFVRRNYLRKKMNVTIQ